MAVDACVAAGLTVTEFSAATCARLARVSAVRRRASAIPWIWWRRRDRRNTGRRSKWPPPLTKPTRCIVIFTPVDTSRSEEILAAIRDGIRAARGAGATASRFSRAS